MYSPLTLKLLFVMALSLVLGAAALEGAAAGQPPKAQRLQFIAPPKSVVYDVAFSPDAKLLAIACEEHEIVIYDVATGKQHLAVDTKLKRVWSVAFAPDGKTLVAGSGSYNKPKDPGELKIWDVQTGKEIAFLNKNGHLGSACKSIFTPDGKFVVSVGWDGTVRIWDVQTSTVIHVLTDHKGPVRTAVFSPDGAVLATGSFDGTVIFWDAKTFKIQRTIKAHTTGVQSVAFAPSGRMFATVDRPKSPTGKGEIKIWDFASGREIRKVQGLGSYMLCVVFSPDERTLAVSGGDRRNSAELKLIEVASGKSRAVLPGHKEWVECVCFSADGSFLISGGGNDLKKPGELTVAYMADLRPAKVEREISAAAAERLWKLLAGDDAVEAFRAMHLLAAAPAQALPLLKEHARPPAPIDEKTALKLINALDDKKFAVREKATEDLAALGEAVGPLVEKTLKANPTLEVRMRLEIVMGKLYSTNSSHLQLFRAIELLEQIGTPEAIAVLEQLTKGPPGMRLTVEAQATAARLSKRKR